MSKILLVLGAGPGVGLSTVKLFANAGWKVAAVSRTIRDEVKSAAHFTHSADLSDQSVVPGIFEAVTKGLGAPTAVVYNAAAANRSSLEDTLSSPPEQFNKDGVVNINNLYAAAYHTVKTWDANPSDAPKTFILTGNACNHVNFPFLVSLGAGKMAAAYVLESASRGYKPKGYRFYFADERLEGGLPGGASIDGDTHAAVYETLINESLEEGKKRGWEIHFVKGQGIHHFGHEVGGHDGLSITRRES